MKVLSFAWLTVGAALTPLGVAKAAPPPAAQLDLSHWALTLPVDYLGRPYGNAVTLPPSYLVGGYSSEYFYTGSDGGVVCYVPAAGATTDSSKYPRTELREEIQPPSTTVNWDMSARAVLDATVAVNKVPISGGKVLIGQIYGYGVGPLAKVYFKPSSTAPRLGNVYGQMMLSPNGAPSYTTWLLARDIPLDRQFAFQLSVINGVLRMSLDAKTKVRTAIDSTWSTVGLYFKAGNYPNSSGLDGDDTRVTLYALRASHQ